MIRRMTALTALFFVLQNVGCDNAADQQKKADTAQKEANERINAAKREAEVTITSAQMEADKKTAEAKKDFDAMNERFRTKTDGEVEMLDRKIAALDRKTASLAGKARSAHVAKLTEIRAARAAVARDLKALETSPATMWDATKAQVERSVASLSELVDAK